MYVDIITNRILIRFKDGVLAVRCQFKYEECRDWRVVGSIPILFPYRKLMYTFFIVGINLYIMTH